jgi:hypothetical protein
MSVRDIGAYFDRDMSMITHINRLVSGSFYQLRRIRYIHRSIPTSAAIKLVNSFVISRVDYCNSLLNGIPAYQLARVQSVLNAVARIIYGGLRWDHITPLLCDRLHWLCVPQRVQFKLGLMVYRALNSLAPPYIADFCKPVSEVARRASLCSSSHHCLVVPWTRSAFGDRSFTVAGPSIWNHLPDNVRSAPVATCSGQ